ncbi:MAG: MopE-related protein, partial [Saprospiraceae bacterium]|nr:MopE-related protein [Saprospiraceae bacterium]
MGVKTFTRTRGANWLQAKLLLTLAFFTTAFAAQAQSGIFESYAVINAGGSDIFYDLQATTINPDFNGANLGSFVQCTGTPLRLDGGQNKTFKCPGDDITNGNIWYRVYPTGSPSGAFTSVNLPNVTNLGTGCSGNDQQWERTNADINLLTGRTPGNYTLEVYTTANFTFSGGGGGSGTHFSNNGGANYSATFTVTGGTGCPVFVTASGGTAFASYATLKAAFDAVNAGTHTGVIAITIGANTTETATAALNASGSGSASYTAISIQPGGGSAVTVSGNLALPLIDFNGADNVTINGLNSGGNSLTISNTSTSATSGTSTIRFIGGATSNTITNCSVLGSFSAGVTTNGGNIFFSTDANTANGNDNNTISNCNIGPAGANLPTKGIYLNGSTTTTAINNSGIIVNNNNIFDFFGAAVSSAGIYVGNGNTDCNFTNNRFYQTATRTQTTGSQHSAVWISNLSGNNFQVTGNTIGFASSTSTGIYTFVGVSSSALIPIFLNVGTTTASNASSNTIAGIAVSGAVSGTSFSAAFRGIYISSGLTTCNSNTIGSLSATGSISYTSSVSSGSDIIGIFNFGSSNWTASNNNIGGITAANSNTGASNIYGIRVNTTPSVTFTCQNNTIGGSVSNSISSTTTATGTIVNGILNSNPAGTITGNTIRNLTSAGGTGTGTSASVIGISVSASSANHTVSQNVIQGLSNTNGSAATTVTGINYSSSSGTNLVARNYIHSLSAASATAILNGINVTGGTTTYQNNMISLGSGISTGMQINGINETVAGTDNFYHNSVYIGGTGVGGSVNTFAFQSSITTNTRNYRDNIFVNVRSNGAGTGKHYAVRVGGSTPNPTGLTINYNDYLANGTGGIFGLFNGADVVSLAGWQTAVGQDANSLSADPLFVSGLDLHLSTNSPAESAGVLIASVTDDFDGQTRAGLTPTDIGADAGNFGPLCSGTPTAGIISSVPLSICNSGSAVLTLTGASFGNGITYQWKEATAPGGPYTNVGTSAATYTTGTISSARYYVVDVTCSAGPSTVTTLEYALVVNPLPTVAVTPTSGLICNPGGSAVSLTASGASTYSWSPSAGLNMTTGATVSANPAATTTYTVTGTDGNGCTNTAMVTVTVGTTPSNPVASASVSSVCPGVPFNLFSGADAPPATLLSQNFESGLGSWTTANLTTGGTPANTAWTIRSHGYVSPNSPPVTFNSPGATSFILSNADHGGSGTLVNTRLTSPTFSAVGYSTLSLSFRHYYRFNSAVEAFVEVSTDGGTNWTTVKSYNANQGTATVFATDNIDLAAYIGQSTVTIRFRYQNGWSWYWGIDDILLTGTPPNYTYSWSSTPSGFTSSTQNPTGVTATTTTTYTATITGLGGCTNTAQVVVTVNPAPTATVSGGGTVCSTDPLPNVDFALTGTGPWDLTYNDGTNNVPVLGIAASPYTITNAPAGTYTVVSVSDANCSGTGSGSVTVAVTPATTWYQDSDMDTYGNLAATLMACSQPVGYVANNTDCDDTDGTINPTTVWYLDADNDNYYVTGSGTTQCISPGAGYKYTGLLGGNDCADGNPAVNPGATEVCNDTDDDCDGMIDEGVQLTFYEDVDGDGFGDPNSFTMDCTAPMGFVANDQDCDDTNDALNPNTVWYLDADNDNYYTGSGVTQCTSPGAGYEYTGLLGGNDCNDANNLINPGATEICDGVDNDCDGMTDDGITFVTYYVDGDNDGYGIGSGQSLCANPGSGFATVAGDCNDANNLINPGATEICADGIDNDCDTQIDENCGSCPATGTTWYVDAAAVSGGNGASWPCAFQQIQTAINAAANGDQIFVAAGTYVENLFVNKSLTITGVAGRDLTFVHAATAAYTLHVDGNAGMPVLGGNVSIEGFTFADPQRLHWRVVATDHIAIGLQLTFRNNRVTNGNRYGWWDYHSHGSLLCENNIFSDVYYGMFLEGWDTGMLTIQNNEFTNLHFYINPMGVPTPAFGGPVGILAMTYSSGGVDCTNPYRIYENHFHTYANDGFGIVFNGGLTGSGSAKYTDVEIARNTIAPGATGTGIRLRNLPAPNNSPNGGVHNALINNNFISNVQYGIRLQGDNPGTQAHENSLVNCSTRAIENTGTLVMDASCNWYGVSTATGVAAQISGNVTYQFWLVNGTDSDLGTLGFQPVAGSCTGCAQPVLQTTINTVVVTSNNDGTEDTGSFSICNGETVTFDNFQDISGLGLTGLKVYQTASYTNISPSFCNNCTDLLSTYTGMSQTASLVNPALSGTLVLRFKAWADANGNNMVDPEECAGDWVKYTITVLPAQLWYTDGDNDGYGTGSGQSLCANPGAGFATVAGDCNDANNLINPGATEICDGVDNDCDAMVDEGAQITYYRDLDGDGFGNPAVTQLACSPPSGYVANNTDCNDNSALEKPGQTWYADADNDNYSNGIFLVQCLRPVGFKAASELIASIGDCNDSNAAINPAAVETCDGVDNNCNGMIDDGVQTTYYRDMDGDGFGNPAVTQMACSPPSGYVTNNTDCNDNSALE